MRDINIYILRCYAVVTETSDWIKCFTDVNPRYVLRNWMAESAIRKAERNDFSEVCV